MRVVRCEQKSPEWRAARAGVITASAADKILTPSKLEPSRSAGAYMNRLVFEWLVGAPIEDPGLSKWTARGTEMEDEARAFFEVEQGKKVDVVGFVTTDDGRVGCSPDGLIGEDEGLEIKVPSGPVQVGYLWHPLTLVAEYRGQVQLSLWVTRRRRWWLESYNPTIGSVILPVERDERYQAALDRAIPDVLAQLSEARARFADTKSFLDSNPLSDAAFARARDEVLEAERAA